MKQTNYNQRNIEPKWTDVQSQSLWYGNEKISMHKYPYKLKDGVKNIWAYRLGNALEEDWHMTRKDVEDRIWDAVQDTFLCGLTVIAFPTIVACAGLSQWKKSRLEKHDRKLKLVKNYANLK